MVLPVELFLAFTLVAAACERCGAAVDGGERVCAECGEALDESSRSEVLDEEDEG